MFENSLSAPGAPGISARWTSSAKSGIGKSINPASDVIFTISHGILNEVYYPREDIACIRDMELFVTDGDSFFAEEKRDTVHDTQWLKPGVPAFKIINTCKYKKFTIIKEIICDPLRHTVLQKVKFTPLQKKDKTKYHVYVLLAPHINNCGAGNTGWLGDYKGVPMLFAKRDGIALALACSSVFLNRSVGYVGTSDGYSDLLEHKKMDWCFERVENGNIALTAEIDVSESNEFILALSFGTKAGEAGHHARASLLDGFEITKKRYVEEWELFQKGLKNVGLGKKGVDKNLRISASVLKLHQSKVFPGAVVASLSIPWGYIKGDDDIGGYHLVWPRDLVESSGGFLALNAEQEMYKVLNYLLSTQEKDGKWSQNMWLDGSPNWNGLQMDEVALPISVVDQYHCTFTIEASKLSRYWPLIKKAISVLLTHGPSTQQDRWEEEAGLSAFTLAAEITALLGAASLADANKEPAIAKYCRETADYWNEQIENWTYVTDTPLAQETGVEGYYLRINPYHLPAQEVRDDFIYIKNRSREKGKMHLYELVSVDALALVRFGLRNANDPKILNTIKVIDEKLKVDTPFGPCWHRYTNDGYGEDTNGDAYSNSQNGIGRAWPLLTGERGHYEIAAGNIEKARELLKTMEGFSNNGLIPEQVWDTEDIPEKRLFKGKYTGSAMPLTWAHAEYIKLYASIKQKRIFDMSLQTEKRYLKDKTTSPYTVWRFGWNCNSISKNKILRIEVMAEATVRLTMDNWQSFSDIETQDTGVGVHYADIHLNDKADKLIFTFFWKKANHWEEKEFTIELKN